MRYRKLKQNEHVKTRMLWEQVFAEDTKAFLDYYYTVKTAENEIYAAEPEMRAMENDGQDFCAMLQLNPYQVYVGDTCLPVNYIIGVATHPEYRKKGLMRQLLHLSMRDMYARGEAFTFLMPAAEAIYRPFDFRFVYDQRQGVLKGKAMTDLSDAIVIRAAEISDCQDIAAFAEGYLQEKDIFVRRNAAYYAVMLAEQASEQGGVTMIEDNGQIKGIFAWAYEENYEVREPLIMAGYEAEFHHALYQMTGDEQSAVKCFGYEGRMEETISKPTIMVRLLDIAKLLTALKVNEEMHLALSVTDPIIAENNTCFCIDGDERSGLVVRRVNAAQSDGQVHVAALAGFLFGYLSLSEIMTEEDVILNEKAQHELKKLILPKKIFLNEIV